MQPQYIKAKRLNKELFTGPDLLNTLAGALLRFRKHKITLARDMEAMLEQMRVKTSDRDALRFLWADSSFREPTKIDTYQMLVHIFGATDSPCCANFAVKCVARDYKERCSRIAIESILIIILIIYSNQSSQQKKHLTWQRKLMM